jgi:hypothetical protein
MTLNDWTPAWRVLLFAAFSVAGAIGLVLLGESEQRDRETVGFIEFTPPAPAGHPAVPTLRLRLNPDDRAWYPCEWSHTEAGVATGAGERLFYVTAELVPVSEAVGGQDLLRTYARQNDLTGHPECQDVATEFRAASRGPVWVQRYTDLLPDRHAEHAAQARRYAAIYDRLEVLRYAEVWNGFVLELRFHLPPGSGTRLEPRIWEMVRGFEVTEQSTRPPPGLPYRTR